MRCGHPSRGAAAQTRSAARRADARISRVLLPRQLVAGVEPRDAFGEEGVALRLEGFRGVEGVQVEVELVGAPLRLVRDRRSAARTMASLDARRRVEGRPFSAEGDRVALEVHEAGHRRSGMAPAAGAMTVRDPARLAARLEAQLTAQAMSGCHVSHPLPRIGSHGVAAGPARARAAPNPPGDPAPSTPGDSRAHPESDPEARAASSWRIRARASWRRGSGTKGSSSRILRSA